MATASYVLDMIMKCKQQSEAEGSAYTVRDHLAKLGIKDRFEFKSLWTAINKRIKLEGSHHDLLGPVFILPPHTTGPFPVGYGEDPPRGSHTVVPVFDQSRSLAPIQEAIEANGYKLPSTVPVLRETVTALDRAPKRAQEAASAGMLKLLDEITYRDMEAGYRDRETELLRSMASPRGPGSPSAPSLPARNR